MAGQKVDSLPALTGLRGIAALWVVLFHLDADHVVPIIKNGYLGVDILFHTQWLYLVACIHPQCHKIFSNTISTILVGSSVTYLSPSFIFVDLHFVGNHYYSRFRRPVFADAGATVWH